MPDITADDVARVATRLFQQQPGVPGSLPVGTLPTGSVPPVTPESLPRPAPASTAPADGLPPSHWPAGEHVALDALFSAGRRIADALPHSGATPWTAPAVALPEPAHAPASEVNRLQEFVRSIHATPYRQENGLCRTDPTRQIAEQLQQRAVTGDRSSRPYDVAVIRRDFPILQQQVHGQPLAWLDNAATTQKPQAVIDALSQFYREDNSNIHRGAHTLAARATDAYEQAREKVRSFLGAGRVEEIVFVRGTTEGINLVTQTYGRKYLQPGDEIILSVLEHHANIVPWQLVAQEKGAVIRVIPVNDRGEIQLEDYQRLLGPRTRIVALTQASNSLGTILPVGEMTQMARRYGARVLIDGAQSVAHLPVNVRQLDCDFFVFSGHKIFGPTGIGAVYARHELLHIMPPWQGGGSMIRDVTFEETTYSDPPAKFEAGTPNIADAVGLGAALDYVNRLGLSNIARYEHELLEYATGKLERIEGLRLIGTAREKVGVLSFVLHNRNPVEVGKLLDLEGIAVRAGHHCAQPSLRRFGLEATVRPSLSVYNTRDEVDRLADAVRRIRQRSP